MLECMSHAPNATHPIPCPSPLVQLPPASQLKPLPSSKVSILMTCKLQSVLFLTDSQSALSILHQPPLISCLSPSGMFGPSPPPSPTTPPCTSDGSPVTLVSTVTKMRIYLPKLVPPCLLTQSHALSPQLLTKSVIPNTTIGDVTSATPI